MDVRTRYSALLALATAAALAIAVPASAPAASAGRSLQPAAVRTVAAGVNLSHLSIGLTKVADGFTNPLYVANAHDGSGRLFVVEQTGAVRVVRHGVVSPGAFLDVSASISTGGERGLLGLAFAPEYASNGRFYIYYTDVNGNTAVQRCIASDPASDTPVVSRQTILTWPQPFVNHNGGCLQFGPDKCLYIGLGDGGSGGDPGNRSQYKKTLLGKLLRIDVGERVSPATFTGTYTIPKSNPFYAKAGYRKEIWALGLRNPWRFSFDAVTGALWIGDVGQDKYEEVDFAKAGVGGQNYGWHIWEGNHRYTTSPKNVSKKGFTFPIFEYPHPVGEAITGGYVYRGSQYPELYGTYVYADYISGWFGGIKRTSTSGKVLKTPQAAHLLATSMQISSLGQGEDRELYACDYSGGGIYHITATTK